MHLDSSADDTLILLADRVDDHEDRIRALEARIGYIEQAIEKLANQGLIFSAFAFAQQELNVYLTNTDTEDEPQPDFTPPDVPWTITDD